MPDTLQSPTQELIAELLTRGASMEQVARLKDPTAKTPEEALQRLKDGNSRFYTETSQPSSVPANARRSQIMSQTPFAVVLGCADSRVPVEIVFDQGPGDIFSIRVAGNVVEPGTLGSAQYAVNHLKVHLIVVLGHEGCGAVAAAMLSPEARSAEAPEIQFLLDKVEPSVRDMPTIRDNKARMREAVISNVRHQKTILESDPVMAKAIASGQIQIVGAFYEIGSGAVDFLED
ncbi:MAG TPA: carbonic anhydrase [Abditibacterium sp.]|jgi:carbonic anhydrase